ncbi:MAG: hypothetical protein HYX40_11990 [Sphingobacteriales bacterium]|nr:hypothetical protein [Sphingobacteriales bacterium]
MKGVTILRDDKTNEKIIQVRLKDIAKNPEEFEDLMDVLIAESRKNEPKKNWEDVKRTLKKNGKL